MDGVPLNAIDLLYWLGRIRGKIEELMTLHNTQFRGLSSSSKHQSGGRRGEVFCKKYFSTPPVVIDLVLGTVKKKPVN